MRKFFTMALFGTNAKTTLVLISAVLVFVALGCSGKKGEKVVSSDYTGNWTTNSGITLNISSDGSVQYRNGASKLDGGKAYVDETGKTLRLDFVGLMTFKEFTIDQAPQNGMMKLDGEIYYTDEGKAKSTAPPPVDVSGQTDASTVIGDASAPTVPSADQNSQLVADTLAKFNEAIQDEDFSTFREENCSAAYKEKFSAADLKKTFSAFIQEKDAIDEILTSTQEMDPNYTQPAKIENSGSTKVLNLTGTFSTYPSNTKFELLFEPEGKQWKVRGVDIKIGK